MRRSALLQAAATWLAELVHTAAQVPLYSSAALSFAVDDFGSCGRKVAGVCSMARGGVLPASPRVRGHLAVGRRRLVGVAVLGRSSGLGFLGGRRTQAGDGMPPWLPLPPLVDLCCLYVK
ncbi:hypothetical protein ABZP36_008993 [Zizania latifolia]